MTKRSTSFLKIIALDSEDPRFDAVFTARAVGGYLPQFEQVFALEPFHTLNPALARFDDGRVMSYGTMGGEGQPQTQAAVFSRYARFGQGVQQAVSAPRWLLGRTWGKPSESLKLESRFDTGVVRELSERGHDVEIIGAYDETVGHAGMIIRHADGVLEGGADPRSDGAVAAY